MAGIGFSLRELARTDDIMGSLRAFMHATLVAAGPWLVTILALGTLSLIADDVARSADVALFRIIIIYNFGFSLIFAGPISIIVTRYLADRIYVRDVTEGPGMLLGAFALMLATQGPLAIGFYGFAVEAPLGVRLVAIAGYLVTGALWIAAVFLSTLKDFRSITYSFSIGMFTGLCCGTFLSDYGAVGLLAGFTIGLAVVLFALVARIFAEYPYPVVRPFAFLAYFRRFWELAAMSFCYNAAIWVDKWVMWLSPEHEIEARALVSYPDYDSAMFLAYLSILPAMALFVLIVETSFFERYLAFFREVQRHGTWARLRAAHIDLLDSVGEGFRILVVLQGALSYLAILLAPAMFEALGLGFAQIAMFRFGVLGALFHAMLLFVLIVFAYFDLRRLALKIVFFFLVANGAISALTLWGGFAWYGYGYFLSAVTTFSIAYAIMLRKIANLPYLVFVEINPSVRHD
ncbi:MAG: exopolysaccharide Pel transporter PelG [Proteobacteria bacterium]|nr:exopolysaccharide Pel transporter PelG [Pseudomonadota bacterium]